MLSEAVAMAVVLSHPPPFMRASHMVTGDPDEANAIVARSFVSAKGRSIMMMCPRRDPLPAQAFLEL